MRRIGRIRAVLAIVATVLLGFGCGGAAHAGAPIAGHHHHQSSGDSPRHDAVLGHVPCCVSVTIPAREAVAVAAPVQRVSWAAPAQAVPAGLRVTPDPRPPKSSL